MIGRVLLAAILAGIAAGLVMGVIQHVRLTPLIIEAEKFEVSESAAPAATNAEAGQDAGQATGQSTEQAAPAMPAGHDHSKMMSGGAAAGEHHHDPNAWAPQDGFERTFYTTITAMLAGAGFSLMLCGISFLSGIPITRQNGFVWGLCGFIAVSLAPAFSLPPELPGMPAAGLFARQAWWVGTIICTGIAIWFAATPRHWLGLAGAFVLAAVPHIYGAPHVPDVDGTLPAGLAAEFAASSLGANLVMWLLIGLFLAVILNPEQEKSA